MKLGNGTRRVKSLYRAVAILLFFLAITPGHSLAQPSFVVRTIQSGNWSDQSTWSDGQIPTEGQAVTIQTGHSVTYDVTSDAVLGQLNVFGALRFSHDANTRLKLGHSLIVHPDANLDMGNPNSPIPAHVRAELVFVLTPTQANAYGGSDVHTQWEAMQTPDIGLWVFGTWNSHGSATVRTWTKLTQPVTPGATSVLVTNDVTDWPVGSTILATSTGTGHESRVISATQRLESGTLITLTAPLNNAHLGGSVQSGEVALLSRNVKVSTEIVGVTAFATPTSRKFAHTVYMPNSTGDLQYTELFRMGHYNKTARYAIHYHRMLAGSTGMVARGNSVWVSGFRCINVHVSHGLIVEDNVCYNVVSGGIFPEAEEAVGYNQDNVYIHNLVAWVHPRNSSELRASAFWPRDQTRHEAWLGNVAVGGAEIGDGAGYSFSEGGNAIASTGSIPFTFVHNEAHTSTRHGIFTWQNTAAKADMVDTLIWGVDHNCIRWGAYRTLLRYYNTQCLNFGTHAVNVTSVDPYIQDAIISGGPYGINLSGYVLAQNPNSGATFSRILFQDITVTAMHQKQQQFANDNANGNECGDQTPGTPRALQQRPMWPGNCSGNFVTLLANSYINVNRALNFGLTANPNSFWMDDEYAYVRPNLSDPAKRGVITTHLVNEHSVHDSAVNALRTPRETLTDTVALSFPNDEPSGYARETINYTLNTVVDYPPVVALDVQFSGTVAKMTADAIDDKAVSRVEFYLNWQLVATDDTPPYEAEVDMVGYELNYAYPYAKVVDNAGQRAYSNTIEIGPEVLILQCIKL